MSALRTAVLAVCAGSIALGGLTLLAPTGRLESSLRYLLGLALAVLLTAPFARPGALPAGTWPQGDAATEAADFTAQQTERALTAAQAAYLARAALAAAGIYPEKIEAKTDISPQGDIVISSIVVTGGRDAAAIRQILREALAVNEVEVKDA